ncbi:MAG: ribbon-helix-helix domain-containing protein, partial [Lachnospiraceae bacterium]|nr:ribbon-helix-helix domain-containing protein [Lachnospiraceae bacterium]
VIMYLKLMEGAYNMDKFIITPKEDKSVTMTIRIDRDLQEKYNSLSVKTNRSRNELICMALQYALDHMEIQEK